MRIRELRPEDAPYLAEWMPDAKDFLRASESAPDERHYAIVSDEDACMGMASLTHIDSAEGFAELRIVVRRIAFSKGYAHCGVVEILDIAFQRLGLNSVYWCVNPDNARAIRFFQKHGFNTLDQDVPENILNRHREEKGLIWYAVLRGDDYRNAALSRGMIAGSRIISIKTVPTIEAGELSFFEARRDIDFDIKRIYYISKVPEGARRGFHAHKELKQLLFCPYGEIQLILDDGSVREEITLNDPSIGIVIEKPTWREMLWLKKDSVLCVAASELYQVADYIRDYQEFQKYVGQK